MSYTLSACNVVQFPKEDRDLARIPKGHPALSEFEAEDIGAGMLFGRVVADCMNEISDRCYGDVFPEEVSAFIATVRWDKATNPDIVPKVRHFLETCKKHSLGFTMN